MRRYRATGTGVKPTWQSRLARPGPVTLVASPFWYTIMLDSGANRCTITLQDSCTRAPHARRGDGRMAYTYPTVAQHLGHWPRC